MISFTKAVSVCDSKIYCQGELLLKIQMKNIFPDSKTFVDMPSRFSEQKILDNFSKLSSDPSLDELQKFLIENFYQAGADVIISEPSDWKELPKFVENIKDKKLKEFGVALNEKWKNLLRKFVKMCDECVSSTIETANAFVVPGGRFIEYYYWDTFWIVEGLLICEMYDTVKGILINFLDIIKKNGYIPNGARIYYLNRSQPPLLTQMISEYFKKTNDYEFLKYAIEYLDLEYNFWMTEKLTSIIINDKTYFLNSYNASTNYPRPESYREDITKGKQTENEGEYYSNVISVAESGWDFSSRWFKDAYNMTTIQIRDLIPVDLNAILYKNEKTLSEMHLRLNNMKKSDFYTNAAKVRLESINTILWSDELSTWADYNIRQSKLNLDHLYISSLTPLWAGIPPPAKLERILFNYESLLKDHISGVPTSNIETGQQWDFPNVWAPYHHWLVLFFIENDYLSLAFDIANRFVNTVYCSFSQQNLIYEKYNADKRGERGEGGEYKVQEGFGWTNGVVIKFLDLFGESFEAPDRCIN
jgi:alpha,alpha-trehalase